MTDALPLRPTRHFRPLRIFTIILASCVTLLSIALILFAVSASVRMFFLQSALTVMGADIALDEHGQANILLLGVGDEHHDGSDLTDTMIVASIDPVHTRSVVLLSLPRDLFLDVSTQMVQGRINAIYANEKYRLERREGMTEEAASAQALRNLGDEIGNKLGIEIHGVLKADFTAFVNIVDAMGGVEVDVPKSIADYSYPIAENHVGLFEIEAGLQHLDGETALKYARSRHSTNDFDRSARQQQLLHALAGKIRALGKIDQINFLTSLQDQLAGHVETTLSGSELLGLAQIATTLSSERVIPMQINFNAGSDNSEAQAGGFVFPAPAEMFDGASILLPIAGSNGKNDWTQIRAFAQMLMAHRDVYLADPVLRIRNMGVSPLVSHRLRNDLLRYGLEVLPTETFDPDTQESIAQSVVLYQDSAHQKMAEFVGNLLSLPIARVHSDEGIGSGDVLVVLGTSFTGKRFYEVNE